MARSSILLVYNFHANWVMMPRGRKVKLLRRKKKKKSCFFFLPFFPKPDLGVSMGGFGELVGAGIRLSLSRGLGGLPVLGKGPNAGVCGGREGGREGRGGRDLHFDVWYCCCLSWVGV